MWNGIAGSTPGRGLSARGAAVPIASRPPPAAPDVARWVRCDVADDDQVAGAYRQAPPEHVVQLAAALQMACEAQPEVVLERTWAEPMLSSGTPQDTASGTYSSQAALPSSVSSRGTRRIARAGPSAGLYGCGAGDATSAGMAQVRKRIESTRLCVPASIAEASGDDLAQLTYVSDAVDATLALMSASKLRHTEYNSAGRENARLP